MQRNVLFCNKSCTNSSAEVLIEESSYLLGRYVSSTFKKALCENGDRIRMRRHELGKDIGEVYFILLGRDWPSFAGRVPVWEED